MDYLTYITSYFTKTVEPENRKTNYWKESNYSLDSDWVVQSQIFEYFY